MLPAAQDRPASRLPAITRVYVGSRLGGDLVRAGQRVDATWVERAHGTGAQKHPSMKVAIRCLGNTMSARRRSPGSGAVSTRYRSPAAWRRRRTASSGAVSRPRFACMIRRVAGDDAKEFSPTGLRCHARRPQPTEARCSIGRFDRRLQLRCIST